MINACVYFLDPFLPREIYTSPNRDCLYLYHFLAPEFDDVDGCFESCKDMRFVLTVDHGVRMRKHLCNVLIVECIYLLILCEGVVQHIHDYAGIIHHAQCVQG